MSNEQLINLLARIDAIRADIEGAKISNLIESRTHPADFVDFKFKPEWFEGKSRELWGISEEAYKY